MYETKTDAKVRGFLAHSKKLARLLSELLRQAWCFATDQEMKGCECRKGAYIISYRHRLLVG